MDPREKVKDNNYEVLKDLTLILFLIIGLTLLIVSLRLFRGIVGLIVGSLMLGLLAYWFMEIRKTASSKTFKVNKTTSWLCDVIDEGEVLKVIAEVPGPEQKVKVKLVKNNKLLIKSIGGFKKTVNLGYKVKVKDVSYSNGILNVTLKKDVSSS